MKLLDLFSGIGGFSLAASWLGVETVGFVEIDPWCQRVLAKNFPGVPIHGDIKTFDGHAYQGVDIITGGFPCQPYSVAGKRGGADDDRAIWPEMLRVIDESRPRYVLGENVPGFIKVGLDQSLADLEACGYTCQAFAVPAVGVDAPHKRERIWIVAHATGMFGPSLERVESDGVLPEVRPLANTESSWELQPEGIVQDIGGRPSNGCRWPAESGVDRMAYGLPERVDRLASLGNAIVPQVAYEIMRVMLEGEL